MLESLQDPWQGLWQLREGKSVLLVLERRVVGNEVEAEPIAGGVKIAMRNTGARLAVGEGGQSGEVVHSELNSVIGRESDGARFARRRVLQVVEAG